MSGSLNSSYFNQSIVWNERPAVYQEQVLGDILSILPRELHSIIDLGCGNGIITNQLPDSIKVVGLDISEEALKHVKRERVQGSITDIPFPDRSFDVVMANDILEHLKTDERILAINEMARVAAKYIIVTVPLLEDLNLGTTHCADCNKFYHVNQHVHSFDIKELQHMFDKHGYRCVAQILTGDTWQCEQPEILFIRRSLGLDIPRLEGNICPNCGSTRTSLSEKESELNKCVNRLGIGLFLNGETQFDCYSLRTECISIYVNHSVNINEPAIKLDFIDWITAPQIFGTKSVQNNQLDFSKADLYRAQFIPRHSLLPYFVANDICSEGVIVSSDNHVLFGFFCLPDKNYGPLMLRLSGYASEPSSIAIRYYDDESGYHEISVAKVKEDFRLDAVLDKPTLSSYGILFEVVTTESPIILNKAELLGVKPRIDTVYCNLIGKSRFLKLPYTENLYLSLPLYGNNLILTDWMRNPKLLNKHQLPLLADCSRKEINDALYKIFKKIFAKEMSRYKRLLTYDIMKFNQYLGDIIKEWHKIEELNAKLDFKVEQLLEQLQQENRILQFQITENERLQELLERVTSERHKLEASNKELLQTLDQLQEENRILRIRLSEIQEENHELNKAVKRPFIYKMKRLIGSLGNGNFVRFAKFKESIVQLCEPNAIFENWNHNKNSNRFLMICHDQQIDRRIIQQAVALKKNGWDGVIVALSFDGDSHLDEYEGVLVHRVGLDIIVPNCPAYWRYQNRRRLILWWGRWLDYLEKINWLLYRIDLLLTYRSRYMGNPLPFDNAFYAAAKCYPADLVIAHDLTALKSAHRISREWNVPLIYDAHELYYEQKVFSEKQKRLMRKVEEKLIRDCDVVFTVNESIANVMAAAYENTSPKVLLNTIDPPEDFDPNANYNLIREKLELPAESVIILFQGGLSRDRNLENLVKSMRYIKHPNAVLVLLGNGPLSGVLQKEVKRNQLNRRVYFLEAVPQKELIFWTASADVGIIPYPHVDLNSYYCTPNKLFEFIQAGVPIIANDSPELRRFVHDTGFGKVGLMDSPESIARLIDSVLMDIDFLAEAKRRIFERQREFTWSASIQRYLDIIEGVIGSCTKTEC